MDIQQAQAGDLPAIIHLLKLSLGESLIPKSESYFLWKHEQNPFGRSPMYLAKEKGELIGLRTFMRWEWQKGEQRLRAVRAVDTATHPEHQGKGIFKKLTLHAVEACKQDGVDIVFNSPNNQSRPGYLKMGWQEVGRMPLLLKPGSLFPARYGEAYAQRVYERFSIQSALKPFTPQHVFPVSKDYFQTPLSESYLRWRYIDCPIVQYGAILEPNRFGVVFRLKPLKRFIELRICDVWCEQPDALADLKKAIREIRNAVRPLMISCAPTQLVKGRLGFLGPYSKGPVTTIRSLALTELKPFEQFNAWQPSIGAMELF